MIDLKQYQCHGVRALYKGIPIEHLEEVQSRLKKNIKGLQYRFRGPRHDLMRLTTLKRDAIKFSVYLRRC